MCTEVAEHLVDGGQYVLLAKSGTDGQSGRGSFSWKDKKVEDSKRWENLKYFFPGPLREYT